ncbi:MAG: hypothetical protein COA43_00930 [Robiginitomaculum sp.]|nr:MAG: hypothetical protein COA43_00930 [Robiginitomaculum sp.]
MKINTTDRYHSLLLKTLTETIIPELSTVGAKSAAEMMSVTLNELLKREHGTAGILLENIRSGIQLLQELSSHLSEPVLLQGVDPKPQDSFAELVESHGVLTHVLAETCTLLNQSSASGTETSKLLLKAAEWELSYYVENSKIVAPKLSTIPSEGSPLTMETLEGYLNSLETNKGHKISVTNFEPLPGGFGKQTYLCQYDDITGKSKDLVIRKTDPTPIMSHGGCNLANEYSLLNVLAKNNFMAPKPIDFCECWENVDGSFYTMDRAKGCTPGSFLAGVEGDLPESLYLELAEWLGKLHSLPLEQFAEHIEKHNDPRILNGTVADAYSYNLEAWEKYISEAHHLDSPYIIWLLHWLQNNIPESNNKPVLVHGDYNVHNVLADNGKITIILDWECADFAGPEQDLAYIKPNIENHIDWDKFISHYQAHGGKQDICEQAMKFGVVYTALRTNLAGNRGTYNLQTGRNQDLRYIMVELGFTQSFMGSAMDNAKSARQS